MRFLTKRGLSIILIALIVLVLFGIYTLKSGSERFAILNIESVESVNNPALKIAIEATEKCNEIEIAYRGACYPGIAWHIGKYYGPTACEKLKEKLKPFCYQGYGRTVGERYTLDITAIKNECLKTGFYEDCLLDASRIVGKESSRFIEAERCQEFEQEEVKQKCYYGIGKQLAEDNKEKNLCEETKDKENCFQGYAYVIDQKGNREGALQICRSLSDEKTIRGCYFQVGMNNPSVYNKTIKESLKDCEQYPHTEICKQGAAKGIAFRFFNSAIEKTKSLKEQKNNVFTPAVFAIYKTINPPATKILYSIIHIATYPLVYRFIIPHLTTYKSPLPPSTYKLLPPPNKPDLLLPSYKLNLLTNLLTILIIFCVVQILKKKEVRKLIKEKLKKLKKKAYQVLALATQKTIRTTVQIQKTLTQTIIQTQTIITQTIKKINKTIIQTRTIITQTIKKINKTIIIPASKFLIQKILIICKKSRLIIQDILSIDKTTINSFFKELKTELGSKEGKKKLLVISIISGLTVMLLAGNIQFCKNF